MTNMGNLLWGTGSTVPADNHVLMLATSGYQPPPVVDSLATGHANMGSYEVVHASPRLRAGIGRYRAGDAARLARQPDQERARLRLRDS